MAERIRIMNFGIEWPPYTHGRVVCMRCETVVAACACPEACRTVGTVEGCPKCSPDKASPAELTTPAPATKYHDARARYLNDARFRAAVDVTVNMAMHNGFTPGELHDIATTAAIVVELKYARPFFAIPREHPSGVAEDMLKKR